MSLITARGVTVKLGRTTILKNINFKIGKGEIVTVVGPNGSGKSTLIRALIGAQEIAAGQIERACDIVIGYVPQRLAVDATMPMTVGRFVNLPVTHTPTLVSDTLKRVGIGDIGDHQMSRLSGGQFQRALLARALLGAPDILVLDEPTQSLDQQGTAVLYALIAEVSAQTGCAVLMVSHDLHVVMSASDRVICLNGHVCCEGTPTVVSAAPEYRALFGLGTQGTLALYRHEHDHDHSHDHHAHD